MFNRLFAPIRLRGRESRNRIVRLPTTSNLGEKSRVGDAMVAHYRRVARGGVGIIVTEGMAIHPGSLRGERSIAAFDPGSVGGLSRLADTVHSEGALLIGQLIHGGRQHHSTRSLPLLWAPSPIACDYSGGVPHPLTVSEIDALVDGFAASAGNARAAGLDGVELHGAQGYLLQQFASPLTNKREDDYGGSFENRMRFPLRVLTAAREAIGPDCILGYRLGVEEFNVAGIKPADAVRMAQYLAATGAIDYLSLSQGNFTSIEMHLPDRHYAPGAFVSLQAEVKRAVPNIPVVVSGRIVDPTAAEEILAAGDADLVGLCRGLTADVDWPRKSKLGTVESIRPCIACNQCWVSSISGEPIKCVVDPLVGNETVAEPPANGAGRLVTVVGGGPAGMESARIAAERGATVTLLEASEVLGGKLLAAAPMPAQAELGLLSRYLAAAVRSSGTKVRLGETACTEALVALRPDTVILACGADTIFPVLESDGSVPVITDPQAAVPLEQGRQSIVVMDEDGHNWGAAVAEKFSELGCTVTVITPFFEPFRELSPVSRGHVLAVLDRRGTVIIPNTRIIAVRDKHLMLRHRFSGRETWLPASTLIWIGAQRGRDDLLNPLVAAGITVNVVGDALAPRRLGNAIAEGRRAGVQATR